VTEIQKTADAKGKHVESLKNIWKSEKRVFVVSEKLRE